MSQSMQWIDLENCVDQYISEAELSVHRKIKLKQLAYRLADELGIDFFYRVQTFLLPMLSNFTVATPANSLRVIKVGVLNAEGGVVALKRNDNISTYADTLPNRNTQIQENAVFNWGQSCEGTWYNGWNGNTYVNYYGAPSGAPFVGEYTVDDTNGVVVLPPGFNYPNLLVECLISPDPDSPCQVPIQFMEAIIAGLAWLDIRSLPASRRGNRGDVAARRREYYNQRRLAQARYKPFDINQAYQLSLEQQRMTVKA